MGKETLRSDGQAVDVLATKTVNKGDFVVDGGFFGIAMGSASSGEDVVLEIAQREHEINVGASITGAKGSIIYIDSDGAFTETSTNNKPAIKVTQSKDANNYIWGILLNQNLDADLLA